ncbi:MAG: sigma-70 family RNA polymerase sigma factor [Eubacteriales bacterium]
MSEEETKTEPNLETHPETKNWTNTQKEQWFTENSSLIHYCVKKYWDYFVKTPSIDIHDLYQISSLAMLSAFDTYDPTKGTKFSTYATVCMENKLKMFVRSEFAEKRPSNIASLNDEDLEEVLQGNFLSGKNFSPEDLYVCRENLKNIYEYVQKRVGKNADVIFTVLCNEISQSSAADLIQCSQSKISQNVKKIRKELNTEFR